MTYKILPATAATIAEIETWLDTEEAAHQAPSDFADDVAGMIEAGESDLRLMVVSAALGDNSG
ncbi:hypothetical protein [Asticcacaulis sp.]|uniref:hypothetical protein n=1 Tax=Asticcacaulis sp. TaxID=1872648 RepID=UPI002B820AAF|nr:hypothetical protein [Asticcacaulis sp.]HTM81912.1 hypothetical protein [Asticcacaulis sp.]